METRGIVILVARIAQIGSVLLPQCLTLCCLELSHRTVVEKLFHGLGVVVDHSLMLVANCKFGLALDCAGDLYISKHIYFFAQDEGIGHLRVANATNHLFNFVFLVPNNF